MKINNEILNNFLDNNFLDAKCELKYSNNFQLLIAVMLSAQTTDKSVNKITPILFDKYKTINDLANARLEDIEEIIKPIGIYKNKAKNIKEISSKIINNFNGDVPNTLEELTTLPGVGRKTASVVLIEGFNKIAFPVDTHIQRVAKRLGIANSNDDAYQVEMKLRKLIDESKLKKAHHQLIFMGRYMCKAIKPNCIECPLKQYCVYNKNLLTISK